MTKEEIVSAFRKAFPEACVVNERQKRPEALSVVVHMPGGRFAGAFWTARRNFRRETEESLRVVIRSVRRDLR